MNDLSPMDQQILHFMVSRKYPPSVREIQHAVGAGSPSTILSHLYQMEEMGLVHRESGNEDCDDHRKDQRTNRCWVINEERMPSIGIWPPDRVPVVGEIVAGKPIDSLAISRSESEEWIIPSFKIPANDETYFALKVRGDSMRDASVLEGDIVILRKDVEYRPGDMVAAWLKSDHTITLKYFFYFNADQIRLQPENIKYDPIILPDSDVEVQGKVIEVIRRYGT